MARRAAPLVAAEETPGAVREFRAWCARYRFDAILTTSRLPLEWLRKMGRRVPEDVGLAHTNLAEDVRDWAGIDPRLEEIAAAAVDLLIGQIHRHETGPPPVQKITSIRGHWTPGKTLPGR